MVMKFLGSVLRPSRSEAITRHLRLCSAALPASGVWQTLTSAERRALFQSVMARGAGMHMAGLTTYEALRSHSPVPLPSLDTIGRDDLALYLEAAASAVESLAETLAPFGPARPPAAEELPAVTYDAEGHEVFEGEFVGDESDEDDEDDDLEDDEEDPLPPRRR